MQTLHSTTFSTGSFQSGCKLNFIPTKQILINISTIQLNYHFIFILFFFFCCNLSESVLLLLLFFFFKRRSIDFSTMVCLTEIEYSEQLQYAGYIPFHNSQVNCFYTKCSLLFHVNHNRNYNILQHPHKQRPPEYILGNNNEHIINIWICCGSLSQNYPLSVL